MPNVYLTKVQPPSSTGTQEVLMNARAARFLHQAQFSATETAIVNVRALGTRAWLDAQFRAPPGQGAWDFMVSQGVMRDRVNGGKADVALWQQLVARPDAVRMRATLALSEILVVSNPNTSFLAAHLMAGYWDLLARNAFGNFRALLEEVTLNPAMGEYLNTAGNLKEDAATGRLPDENFGREVMQLFTIGLYQLNSDGSIRLGSNGQPLETYTQSDVSNIARVFTGWNTDYWRYAATAANPDLLLRPEQLRQPLQLTDANHSTLAASFLGLTIPANTPGRQALTMTLDHLFNHPNVGPFIGKQLIQRLVTSNPSPAYISRVSAAFNNNGRGVRGDLEAVFRAVLLDVEARDDPITQGLTGKLREPIVRFVQWARTFNLVLGDNWTRINGWEGSYNLSSPTLLGQSPLRSPSVFNFFRPGYVPANTAFATQRKLAPEYQIVNEVSALGYINYMGRVIRNDWGTGIGARIAGDTTSNLGQIPYLPLDKALYWKELGPYINDPPAMVARLNLWFCANQLSAATVSTIATAVASISLVPRYTNDTEGPKNRLYTAIWLTMVSPEYLIQK